MGNPIVSVRNVVPDRRYSVEINPANFWKALVAKTTPNLTGTGTGLKDNLVRLALGPQFTTQEIIEGDIATNIDGSPLNEHFSPVDFTRLVVQGVLTDPFNDYAGARDHFFSRQVLEEAGIVPKEDNAPISPTAV